jgi:hypothetical protein
VKRRKEYREIIPAIKDHNGTIITDTTVKANILNSYYSSVFCCDRNIPEIKLANSVETFIINTRVIRKIWAEIGKNKPVGPDGFLGKILKLGEKAKTPYLVRLLEISLQNANIPRVWKIATVAPIYKGGYRSALSNYVYISLTSLICNQLEHVMAGYLRQEWVKTDWLYEGQHGFRQGYSCEIKVITVCQNIAHSVDEYRCDYNRLIQGFRFSFSWSAAYETGGLGRGFVGRRLGKGITGRSYTKGEV